MYIYISLICLRRLRMTPRPNVNFAILQLGRLLKIYQLIRLAKLKKMSDWC